MIAFTDWRVFLLVLLTFAIMFAWKRIVSLASVTCAATYPVYAFLLTFFLSFRRDGAPLWYLLFATAAALFVGLTVLIKHHANIGRLLRGEEKPSSWAGKSDPSRRKPGPDFHDYFVSFPPFLRLFSPGILRQRGG